MFRATIAESDESQTSEVAVSLSSDFACERVPVPPGFPEDLPGRWQVTLADGTRFIWEGFYTGPRTLSTAELRECARELLGLELEDVPEAARRELKPYISDGRPVPSIVLHSATPVLRSVQADLSDAMNSRSPDDVATYVETRAVCLAKPGDLVVGRTKTWETAAKLAGVEAVAVPGIDYYYLSHAILRIALDTNGRDTAILRMVQQLRRRPDTLIRLYSLDHEIQMVLLYLKRLAGVDAVYTDANAPEVADYWNTKGPLHPTVEDADSLGLVAKDPFETLTAESRLSPLARRLDIECPVLPGYTINSSAEEPVVIGRFLRAASLLTHRYGIDTGCLKPSKGGAGARIIRGVRLGDEAELRKLATAAWRTGEDYILEAHVDYTKVVLGGQTLTVAPSGHIRYGHVADGLTLQITNGTSWQGNVYFDEATCETAGLSKDRYRAIRTNLELLHSAFTGRRLDLVTAGFDFAVGVVGGLFGDRKLIALQDPNMSSHGAEYLRLFRDEVAERHGPAYAATRVVIPRVPLTDLCAADTVEARRTFKVLSSVPGRWGMIAAAAEDPDAAVREITARAGELADRGMISEAVPR
jgi:hypothetical protein